MGIYQATWSLLRFLRKPNVDSQSLQENFRIEISFLKANLPFNRVCRQHRSGACDDPFILDIIAAVDNSNDFADERLDRFVNSEDIRVLLLTISCHDTDNITIVHRILDVGMLGVDRSQRPVNGNGDSASDNRISHRNPASSCPHVPFIVHDRPHVSRRLIPEHTRIPFDTQKSLLIRSMPKKCRLIP